MQSTPKSGSHLDASTIGEMASFSEISGIGEMGFEEDGKDKSDKEILALQKEIAKCQKDLEEKRVSTLYYA